MAFSDVQIRPKVGFAPAAVIRNSDVMERRCPLLPQRRTFAKATVTSALCQEQTHAPQQLAASLDHLVGTGEKRRRHRYADCLGSLYIDDELKFGRGLHRKVGRVGPAQYQTDIGYCLLDQLV